MRRGDLITLLVTVAWPLTALAQQNAIPLVGFINSQSPDRLPAAWPAAFEDGLKEKGYIAGRNVRLEYRWAGGEYEQLPALAADLVSHEPKVIAATGGDVVTLAVKSASTTIPIVFSSGYDPVKLGLVASLARPGGNLTGVSVIAGALGAKRLGLLKEIVPRASLIAVLVQPENPNVARDLEDITKAASDVSARVQALSARTPADVDAAFKIAASQHADALMVNPDPFFVTQRQHLIASAATYKIPTMYYSRDYPAAGGLISYGASFADSYRQIGAYTGRILKGEKPADLPVLQPTKFELVINTNAAKALGLTLSSGLLAIADEVIE